MVIGLLRAAAQCGVQDIVAAVVGLACDEVLASVGQISHIGDLNKTGEDSALSLAVPGRPQEHQVMAIAAGIAALIPAGDILILKQVQKTAGVLDPEGSGSSTVDQSQLGGVVAVGEAAVAGACVGINVDHSAVGQGVVQIPAAAFRPGQGIHDVGQGGLHAAVHGCDCRNSCGDAAGGDLCHGGIVGGVSGNGVVAGGILQGPGLTLADLHIDEVQTGVVFKGHHIIHVDGGEDDLRMCIGVGVVALVQQGNAAVTHLGDAVVGIGLVFAGDDVVGVGQLHGLVVIEQEDIQTTVPAFADVGGTGDQNDVLAVDLLGVNQGSQLVVGTLDCLGGNLGGLGVADIIVGCFVPDHVGVAQDGVAVTVEHTDSAIVQGHTGGLGGPARGGYIFTAVPLAVGILPNQSSVLGAEVILVGGEDHTAVSLVVSTVAGADQQGLLVRCLQVQQLRIGPGQTIGGGGHVQVVGGEGLVGGVGEEQVGVNAFALDIEVGIDCIARYLSTGGGPDLAVSQVVAIDSLGCIVSIGVTAKANAVLGIAAQDQIAGLVKTGAAPLRFVSGGVDGEACGEQVCDHVGGGAIGGDGGVDDAAGSVDPVVTVVAKVVGEGVFPGLTIVPGDRNNGIQAACVGSAVPAGVAGCDQGSVIQGNDTGNTEVVAAAGTGRKGLARGDIVGRLLRDLHCTDAHSHQAEEHACSKQKTHHSSEFVLHMGPPSCFCCECFVPYESSFIVYHPQ